MTQDRESIKTELDKGRFALIGAGRLGEMTLQMWPEAIAKPEFVLDSFKTGELMGIPIEPMGNHVLDPELCYLLAIFETSPATIQGIYKGLPDLPLITVYDFLDRHCRKAFSNGWSHLDAGPNIREQIQQSQGVFANATSRQVYKAAAAWRYDRALLSDYPTVAGKGRFDLTAFGLGNGHYDLVIDGGAYDLSLMEALITAKVTCDHYIAFEPDPDNLQLTRQKAQAYGDKVVIEPLALADEVGPAPFIANGLMSARLEPGATASTEVTSLDTYLAETVCAVGRPKRILCKLHVESAEPRALEGAKQMIADHPVDWFVSISHDETSFLTIPVWLDRLGCYDLFLRSYSLFGEGLTLFAKHKGLSPS